jgi:hypothetical protein
VRERYEELLWWLLMPSLLRLAGETVPSRVAANRAAVQTMSRTIDEALEAAEAVGYRVDLLADPHDITDSGVTSSPRIESQAVNRSSRPLNRKSRTQKD